MKPFVLFFLSLFTLPLFAATVQKEIVDGIEWTYTVTNGEATIESGKDNYTCPAIPQTTQGAITIPEQLGGYPVTSIGSQAFFYCDKLTTILIPTNVTTIGRLAFEGCSSLRSVIIPDGVTSIENGTFFNCSSLGTLEIPKGVRSIGEYAFYNCSSLESIIIPDGVTSITRGVFSECVSLKSVVLPVSVTVIEDEAFFCCFSLASIALPDGVVSIGSQAFKACSSLKTMTIPDGVTSLASEMFADCSSLNSINLHPNVTSIGSKAFLNCSSLKSIVLPEGIMSIGQFAFSPRTKLIWNGNGEETPPEWISTLVKESPWTNITNRVEYPKEYADKWESKWKHDALLARLAVGPNTQAKVQIETEMPTPKTMKVTYVVKSELPTVKVRAVAWKDGVRSFAYIVPIRTGKDIPNGESVTTNEEHTFMWDVASDWDTDLDKVKVEILVQEGTLLPQELITIPATKTHKAMTITRNALAGQWGLNASWIFNALVWCYAEGDSQLKVNAGQVSVNGVLIAKDKELPTEEGWGGRDTSYWKHAATTLLNYLYGKMGYKVLAGEDLDYAEHATRLDFADADASYPHHPLRQVSVKIEEE